MKFPFSLITVFIFVFGFPSPFLFSFNFNLLTKRVDNGGGKDVDIKILSNELRKLGHKVKVINFSKRKNIPIADVNIFLAQCEKELFSHAKLNWFIPNPENLDLRRIPISVLRELDLILCKTRDSLRILNSFGKTYFLGFTTIDRHLPEIDKNFKQLIHVSGKSSLKGTEEIIKTWTNPSQNMPALILLTFKGRYNFNQIPENLRLVEKRITESSLIKLQNFCGIHLCPSKAEGFGHYIMEAMSAEAVVITTNAPPMNEFILDERCLVGYKKKEKRNLANSYTISKNQLTSVIKKLENLSDEELCAIGKKNREVFLLKDREFKENFKALIKKAEKKLKH